MLHQITREGISLKRNAHPIYQNGLILGPPGVGKTTLINKISINYPKLRYISLGDICRNLPENSPEKKELLKHYALASPIGPGEFFVNLVRPYIFEASKNEYGFILDGIPKKAEETQLLIEMLHSINLKLDFVISLHASSHTCYERLTQRRERVLDSHKIYSNRIKIYNKSYKSIINDLLDENILHISIDTDNLTTEKVNELCIKQIMSSCL